MPDKKLSVEEQAAAEAANKSETTGADDQGNGGEGELNDPLKKELEKVQKDKNKPRSRKEKIIYKKELLEKELAALEDGEEGEEGAEDDADEDKPVTIGMLNKRERERVREDALTLADEIENETERELVKHHIENTIKPSGDPQKDFRNARAIVNSVKNSQIIEEVGRKTNPQRNGTGAGAPAKKGSEVFEPTADEAVFMRAPYNLTKEDILKAREKRQQSQA